MCAAILYGKVNLTQSHANIMFSNSVCIQYEEEEDEIEDDEEGSDWIPIFIDDDVVAAAVAKDEESKKEESKFVDQYNGCPILKFQVVNELANQEGGELVDCFMKAVGVKFKGRDGNVTEHQYVRVNLVDYELRTPISQSNLAWCAHIGCIVSSSDRRGTGTDQREQWLVA